MLLIIFLVLIAKLALVSGDCKYGNPKIKDFDWNKFSGPGHMYLFLHSSIDFENDLDCFDNVVSSPVGNRSFVSADVYVISEKRPTKTYGYITNWNSSGYFELHHQKHLWNAHAYILAIDYDRYFIGKLCPFKTNKAQFHVFYRSQHPDDATRNEVLKELQENGIDISQLVEMRADNCEQAESSTEGEDSA